MIARRKAGVTEQSASSAVRVYGGQVDAAFPERYPPGILWGASAMSLYDSRADLDVRRASLVLLGAVGFVLLIACVNLTNLFVARAVARTREVAVRMAIGASRLRVARQFLVESLLLTFLGGVSGLIVASVLLQGARLLLPDSDVFFSSPIAPGVARIRGAAGLTRIAATMIDLDWATKLFTVGIAVAAGLLMAVAPVLLASTLRPLEAIKASGGAGTARGFSGLGMRAVLVTTQVSLALVLLAGAGLMLKSAYRLQRTDIGVNPADVLTVRMELPSAEYTPETGLAFYLAVVERVRAIPGVESVGLGNCAPISGGCNGTSFWQPRVAPRRGPGVDPLVGINWATADYFSSLGIQLRRGRNFNDQDRVGRPKVAIVNEEAARTFWPNDTPLGKIIAVGQGGFTDGAEVIGVVSNVRYRTIETGPQPDVYVPISQSYRPFMTLFVRSCLNPTVLAATIRQEVRALDPSLPLADAKTMNERLGDAMWRTRIAVWLFSAFAVLALLLTAIGIFGVMSQTVSQRTPEIGVRMALGAESRDVLRLVLGRAALSAGVGLVVGLVLALGFTRVMTMLLYQVEPSDPSTFASMSAVLAAVAMLACYLPARRAARVDPLVALRYE
jgi:putative ABC transport system permease protein